MIKPYEPTEPSLTNTVVMPHNTVFRVGNKRFTYPKRSRIRTVRGEFIRPDDFSPEIPYTWAKPLVEIYLAHGLFAVLEASRDALVHVVKLDTPIGAPEKYEVVLPENDVKFVKPRFVRLFRDA